MAKVTVVVRGGKEGTQGVFRKGDLRYAVRETETYWKLVGLDMPIKVEMQWSRKDFPTFEEWTDELLSNGYEKE